MDLMGWVEKDIKEFSELPLEEKARIANTSEWNLMDLYFSLSVDIEDKFCLQENETLAESCRAVSGDDYFFVQEATYLFSRAIFST